MATLQSMYQTACANMPGGVNSSVRLNQAIGAPLYIKHSEGSRVWDIEGREFIDMCCGHGAGLLGYKHAAVVEAVQTAIDMGFAGSFETIWQQNLAAKIAKSIPSAQMMRFVSSGSEATLHLIRACRGYTGRSKIIRFEGHFHGYHELIYCGGNPPADYLKANREKPYVESAGILDEYSKFIIPIPFNDEKAVTDAVETHGKDIALMILEPVNYNCACIMPKPGYLNFLRKICDESGILLFFDEIQSCFKKSIGGAQVDFDVIPDVCTIGKALGGGLPLSAFCGKKQIMDVIKPVGPVQHSGTFNATLIPILAGNAFMDTAEKPDFYPRLQKLEKQFHEGIDTIIKTHDFNMIVPNHGARFAIVFGRKTPAQRYEDTFSHDKNVMLSFISKCFKKGVYFHDYGGGASHHGYSIQHDSEDINACLNVIESSLIEMRKDGLAI